MWTNYCTLFNVYNSNIKIYVLYRANIPLLPQPTHTSLMISMRIEWEMIDIIVAKKDVKVKDHIN